MTNGSSPIHQLRTTLSVIGPHSGCGKSAFITALVRHIPGLGCLKVSLTGGRSDGNSVPASPPGEGIYLEDRALLDSPGKDTAAYLKAGAAQVERLVHRWDVPIPPGVASRRSAESDAHSGVRVGPGTADESTDGADVKEGLAAGLKIALQRFPPAMPVIVESSSAVQLLKPVAVILVVRPPLRAMKPTTEAILSHVTDLLINASQRESLAAEAADQLQSTFPSLRPRFSWFADLVNEALPTGMLARLQDLCA